MSDTEQLKCRYCATPILNINYWLRDDEITTQLKIKCPNSQCEHETMFVLKGRFHLGPISKEESRNPTIISSIDDVGDGVFQIEVIKNGNN